MPRLKVDDDELDLDELEEAEYEESSYQPYTGKQPPKGTLLHGFIKKAWWTYNNDNKRMIVLIFEATEESGQYSGLGVWERLSLTTASKFKWQPFLDATGLTLVDIKKKMIVEREDENQGRPITKIGNLVIGDEEKSAICIITKKDRYNDEWETKVDKWVEWQDPDGDEDDEDDEDDDVDFEDEEEEEAPAPKRRAAASATRSGARTDRTPAKPAAKRRAPEPEPEDEDEEEDEELDDEYEDEDEEQEEPPAKPARKGSAGRPVARATAARPKPVARVSRTGSGAPARSGRVVKATPKKGRKPAGYDDDPPF